MQVITYKCDVKHSIFSFLLYPDLLLSTGFVILKLGQSQMTKHSQRIILAHILRLKSWVNPWHNKSYVNLLKPELPSFQSWLAIVAETLVQAKSDSVTNSAQIAKECPDSLVICHLLFILFKYDHKK